jgi:hypothetical protein
MALRPNGYGMSATEIRAIRNPQNFAVGERVEVTVKTHRDFGRSGVIEKIEGVEVPTGKPRAHIKQEDGTYIHVSLPNLTRAFS